MINIRHTTNSGYYIFGKVDTVDNTMELSYRDSSDVVLDSVSESISEVMISGLNSTVDGFIQKWTDGKLVMQVQRESVDEFGGTIDVVKKTIELLNTGTDNIVDSIISSSENLKLTKWIPNKLESDSDLIPTGYTEIVGLTPIASSKIDDAVNIFDENPASFWVDSRQNYDYSTLDDIMFIGGSFNTPTKVGKIEILFNPQIRTNCVAIDGKTISGDWVKLGVVRCNVGSEVNYRSTITINSDKELTTVRVRPNKPIVGEGGTGLTVLSLTELSLYKPEY